MKASADKFPAGAAGPGADYHSFLERLPEPAMFADRGGTIVAMNHEGLALLEAEAAAQVVGRKIVSFVAPEERDKGASGYSEAVQGSAARHCYELLTLKGRRRTVDVVVAPFVVSAAGEVELVLGLARDVTADQRAARAQSFLAAIVESSDDAIVSYSPDLQITTWNQGAQKLLGFTAEEAIGQPATLYIPPEMRSWGEGFLRELQGQLDRVHSFEVPCLRKDGSRVDVWTVCFGIRDSSGALLGMSAIHRDISERKRAEQARDFLAAIVESSDDAIVSIDRQFRITTWNQGAEKLLGFTAAEALSKTFTIYVPAHMRATAEEMVTGLLAHPEQVNRAEVPCQRKDGSLVDVSLVAFAIRDRGGKVLGMSAVHRDITERKGAERQQALLAAIVESSDDAIITKAPDYTIQTWNGGAERLYGYCAAEIIGQPITILIPPDRLDELEQVVGRVLKGEKIHQYETQRRHKDGRLIDVSLSEALVRDRSGRITGVAAIERDISERVRTRRLESQMASIVKSTTDAIYSVGSGHVVQTWNAGAERLFGYRAEEVIGRPSPTMIPECQAQLDEMLGRVLDGGETVEFESKRRRKDGVILDLAVTASPIYDNSGMASGLAVLTRDITQRKRAERALVEAQKELRSRMRQQAAVARLGQRGLGRIEPEELMAEAARLTAQTLGVDRCAIAELQPDGKALLLRAGAGWLQGTGGNPAIELGKDSQAAYVLGCREPVVVRDFASETRFQPSPLLGGDGAASGLAVIIPDSSKPHGIMAVHHTTVREFSRDDINFVQAIAHIVAQVIERRDTEQELKAARDEALASARAKSAFLANMSHEIRTPLNAIVGLSGLLLETALSEEQRDFAQTIRGSSDVLLDTINNVLDFTKVSSGKMMLEHTEFDLRTITQTAVDILAGAAHEKNLELALSVDGQVPNVLRGDPGRLRQVLVNLLSNAVKFTAHGEVVVRVTLEADAEKKALVRFAVSDTGVGLSEQTQHRLFQPFYQADSSTTRRFGGSGLGLAISAQLVELMGGRIGVTSRLGEGATFWFIVPLEKPSLAAIPAPAEGLANLHALIVDDNGTNRQIVRQQMESWGMRADSASNGAEALAILRKETGTDPYAIAVVDFQMPEMDGLELAEKIKADPQLAKIHLVMMSSGGGQSGDDRRAALLDAWLAKPVKAPELFRCLTSLHGDSEQPKPTAAPAVHTGGGGAASAHGGNILLAEDNPVNQKVATIQLRKLGYHADVAGNGREALAALARACYDLVLMDCQMPEMDGYQATAEIRKHEAGSARHTIVIAMTAFGLSGDREKCLDAGMDDYLPKPVRLEQLKEMLDRWLGSKTAVPAEAATQSSGAAKDEASG